MKSSSSFLALLFLAFGLVLAGCDSGGENSGGDDSEALIPLKQGNSWTVQEEDEGTTRTIVLTISTTETHDGTQYFRMGANIEEFSIDMLDIAQVENGLIVDGRGSFENELLLRYPTSEGESYSYTDESGRNSYDVQVAEEEVEVPAGTFDCLRYHVEITDGLDAGYDAFVYLSPGNGPVQFIGGDGEYNAVLTSFDVD